MALASVLAMDPPILILDEPTVGLDRSGKAMIGSVLRSLHREGKTIIVIGHDLAELRALAPRLVVMHRGAVVADGELSKGDLPNTAFPAAALSTKRNASKAFP